MGFFFFDDSKHPHRGEFVVGAWVYTETDPSPNIDAAIKAVGLTPGVDEFKSCSKMSTQPEQANLRGLLSQIECTIALVVCPYSQLHELGREGTKALSSLAQQRPLPSGQHYSYFDREIFGSKTAGEDAFESYGLKQSVAGHFEQDSKLIRGIQLADLIAHRCSMMLLEQLGITSKYIKAGENSGYDPNLQISLGFELWASIRYRWFHGSAPKIAEDEEIDQLKHATVPVLNYGLFVSDKCTSQLRNAAESRFGSMYLGCIH